MNNNELIKLELSRIADQNDGVLRPRDIVEAAKDEHSILHGYFTWDAEAACEKLWLIEAGYLIRRIKLNIVRLPTETREIEIQVTREYESRPSMRNSEGGYENFASLVKSDDKRREMLLTLMRDLTSLKRKYERYEDLDAWITAKIKEVDRLASEAA